MNRTAPRIGATHQDKDCCVAFHRTPELYWQKKYPSPERGVPC